MLVTKPIAGVTKTVMLIRIIKAIAPCIIAGGAARRALVGAEDGYRDIDVFVQNTKAASDMVIGLTDLGAVVASAAASNIVINLGAVAVASDATTSKGVINLSLKYASEQRQIQIITMPEASSIGNLFKTFDFTCCCLTTDGHQVWGTPKAFADVESKTLRLTDDKPPMSKTAERVGKYAQTYGFIPVPGLMKSIFSVIADRIKDDLTYESPDSYV